MTPALGETRTQRRQRRAQAVIDAMRWGGTVDEHDDALLARALGKSKVLPVDFTRRRTRADGWDTAG